MVAQKDLLIFAKKINKQFPTRTTFDASLF